MYIIEKLIRLYFKYKKKEQIITINNNNENVELEDVITCNHHFMPIDSTNRIFACSKCGYVVTKKRLINKKTNKNKDNL